MNCECIQKVNAELAKKHLALRLHSTVNTKTWETGESLAIETYSLKKGVKATPLFMSFCPFCGTPNK